MSARSNKKVGVLELDAPADPTQVAPKTVAPNSPNTGPPQQVVDEQALIEEARRRQRRRRHRVAVACVAVAIIGALIYVVGSGGGGTAPRNKTARSSSSSSTAPQARWQKRTADSLPRGSTVNSIVSYQGILYAAGTYFSGGSPTPGYPQYSEPFVWTSADGGPWKPVWPSSGGVVVGTGADQHLLSTSIGCSSSPEAPPAVPCGASRADRASSESAFPPSWRARRSTGRHGTRDDSWLSNRTSTPLPSAVAPSSGARPTA